MGPIIDSFGLSLTTMLIGITMAIPVVIGIMLGLNQKYADNKFMLGFAIISVLLVLFVRIAGISLRQSIWTFILINILIISITYGLTLIVGRRLKKDNF